MKEVSIIGVDLAKNVFQLHGASAGRIGRVPQEVVTAAIRAVYGGPSGLQGRDGGVPQRPSLGAGIDGYGHRVRLIAPHYVKPFLKRQKNDAADAEAIVEAALRPTMRFVEPKTVEQQARAVAFRTREQP